jgi:hypothetical protein
MSETNERERNEFYINIFDIKPKKYCDYSTFTGKKFVIVEIIV